MHQTQMELLAVGLGLVMAFVSAQDPATVILEELAVVELLPRETIFFVAIGNAEEFLQKIGERGLARQYQDFYQKTAAELEQKVGANLLSPAGLREAGLNPREAAGFAVSDTCPGTSIFFAGVLDQDRLLGNFSRVAAANRIALQTALIGDALIVYPGESPEVYAMLRKGYLFVFYGGYAADRLSGVKTVARVEKNTSLAGDPIYIKASRAPGFGRDIGAYFNFSYLVGRDLKRMERELTSPVAEEWEKEYRPYLQKQYDRTKLLLGPVKGIAAGVDLEAKSLRAKLRIELEAGSCYDRMLRREDSPLLLPKIGSCPLFLASGAINFPAVAEFWERAFDRGEFAEFKKQLQNVAQIDFARDFLPMFSGEVGVALTGDIAPPPREGIKRPGFSLLARLTDPPQAREILDKFASAAKLKKEGEVFEIADSYWKNIYLAIIDDCLVIFTDKIASGEKSDFAGLYKNAEIRNFLVPNTSALFTLDFAMLLFLFSADPPDVRLAETDAVPSEEYAQKQEEIRVLRERLDALRKKNHEGEYAMALHLFRRFGTTAVLAVSEPGGLTVHAAQFFEDESVAAVVAHTVEDFLKMQEHGRKRHAEEGEIWDKIWELERQLPWDDWDDSGGEEEWQDRDDPGSDEAR